MEGEGGEELSIEELASNLSTYKDQLHQVPTLLSSSSSSLIYLFLFLLSLIFNVTVDML